MNETIRARYLAMSDPQRLVFLAWLSNSLTIHGRAFGLDLAGDKQIKAFTGLNELQHQLSQHIAHLGAKDSKRHPEDVLWEILHEKALSYGLSAHLKHSLESIASHLDGQNLEGK